MWNACFICGVGRMRFGVNVPGIHPVEIIAAVVVAVKPRIGAYIVTLWLWGIIVNLLLNAVQAIDDKGTVRDTFSRTVP